MARPFIYNAKTNLKKSKNEFFYPENRKKKSFNLKKSNMLLWPIFALIT